MRQKTEMSAKNTWVFIATSEALRSSFYGVLVNGGFLFFRFLLKVAVVPKSLVLLLLVGF